MRILLFAAAFLLAFVPAFPQSTSRIVGTVRDASAAVVPNVDVVVVHVDTGARRPVRTNATGDYVATALPVGRYRIEVQVEGFKRYTRSGVQLAVEQTARVDIVLETGQVAESITVESSAPVVNSETSSVGQVVEETQVKQLPLNGRHFMQLGLLVPGTVPGRDSTIESRQGGLSIAVNGQPANQNNWMLDGVDNNAIMFGLAVIVPSTEAIREFRLETSNYSAEYGRAGGGVVNVQIRSGGNQFHGSLFEYHRNENLDSVRYFDVGVPPLTFNQFGGTVGGPVKRDRTFFFFNYEDQRVRRGRTLGGNVPTAAQKAGDYSAMPAIFDPLTLAGNTRTAFAGNRIPSSRFHSASRQLWDYYPLPNSTDPARNFARQAAGIDDAKQMHARGDQKITERQWVFGRVSIVKGDAFVVSTLPTDGQVHKNSHYAWAAEHTYTIRSNMINQLRAGGNRYKFNFTHETAGQDISRKVGLPNYATDPIYDGMPELQLTGFPNLGTTAAVPLTRKEDTVQIVDTFTWNRGGHTLKMGGDFHVYRSMNDQVQFARGRYNFAGVFTGQAGRTYPDAFADFQLGYPRTYQVLLDAKSALPNRPEYERNSAFLQDDWKISSRLTMNAGIRWEHHGGWRDADNRVGSFDTTTGEIVYAKDYPLDYRLRFPHRMGTNNLLEPALNGFGPRLGFAYRPFGGTKLVVRSAYGLFWSQLTSQDLVNSGIQLPPGQIRDSRTSGNTMPEFSFGELSVRPGADPSSLIPAVPTVGALSLGRRRNPYLQQWNFGIETEVLPSTGIGVSYVGSKGTFVRQAYNGNPALPPGPGAIQARRRYPAFSNISLQSSDGNSWYHALQVKAERRFRQGLSFLISHTYAKALDDSGGFQNPDVRSLAKARADYDLRQAFSSAVVYELPFGRGRSFLSSGPRVLDLLIREWQTTAIVTARSGIPFSVAAPGDPANAAAGSVYANVRGNSNGSLPVSDRTINRWFDTSAFSAPLQYTFGTAGRNILEGPGLMTLDVGLSRFFTIHESHKLQFRGEIFNLTDRANFGTPSASVGNVAFGTIRSTGAAREVQLALRYQF